MGPDNFESVLQDPTIGNVSELKEGNYILEITTAAGCSDTSSVYVEVLRQVEVEAVSSDATLCLDGPTTVRLTPTVSPIDPGNYSYSWRGPSAFSSIEREAIIPDATAAAYRGNYFLTVTSADGCVSEEFPYFLNIKDQPLTPALPVPVNDDNSYCVGEEIRLSTTLYNGADVEYFWITPGGNLMATSDNLLIINEANVLDAGEYSVFVIVDGCVSDTSALSPIQVFENPLITAASNSPVCRGDQIFLSTDFYPGATYAWEGPNSFNSGSFNPVHDSGKPSR